MSGAHDLPAAFRAIRRRPVATAVAVLTLALGIGATTALLGMADQVLLRPLPYPDANRLHLVWGVTDRYDGYWQRRFGGDAKVVGRDVVLDGAPHTVVGVMPQGFQWPEWSELRIPVANLVARVPGLHQRDARGIPAHLPGSARARAWWRRNPS